MARPALTSEQRRDQEHRQQRQLLRGMAESIGEKGYSATTIADVVRYARVSKSTFYAHFADKEECFVELYSAATDTVLAAMEASDLEAGAAGLPWREHLRAVNRAYLQALTAVRMQLERLRDDLDDPSQRQSASELVRDVAANGKLPVVNFVAGGIAIPADAAVAASAPARVVLVSPKTSTQSGCMPRICCRY